MTYKEALLYLDDIFGLGSKLGLSRIKVLMEKLGNPQDKLKIIHVAGTNGKGSTCAMLSSILLEAGYAVGTYTSPHLEEYNERYTINNIKITNEDFAYYIAIIKEKCDELELTEEGMPTLFEVITALAFKYFYDKKVDILILEVGLGGRYDATNIIKSPLLSIITSIGMDHIDYLGDKLSGIAMEKGGIIKQGVPTVLYNQSVEVYNVISNIAKEKESDLYYALYEEIKVFSQDLRGTVFSIKNRYFKYDRIQLSLLGDYQLKNCATVLLAVEALKEKDISISENHILKGIKNAGWNGRMEVCGVDPIVIVDGAHNTDGIIMLSKSLKKYFEGKNITLILGILGDKEYKKMIEVLLPLVSKVIATEPNNPRALDIASLEEVVSLYNKPVYKEKDIRKAYEQALSVTDNEDVIVCAGSLYLIGELRNIINNYNLQAI